MQAWLYKHMSPSTCNPACAWIQHDQQYPVASHDMTVGLRHGSSPFMTLLQHASHRQVFASLPDGFKSQPALMSQFVVLNFVRMVL